MDAVKCCSRLMMQRNILKCCDTPTLKIPTSVSGGDFGQQVINYVLNEHGGCILVMVQVVRCHTTGVVGALCPSYLSEEHHLAMVPLGTLDHVLLQGRGIHAEVDMKGNSDLEVFSRKITTKAYHSVLPDNETLRPGDNVPAQGNHH